MNLRSVGLVGLLSLVALGAMIFMVAKPSHEEALLDFASVVDGGASETFTIGAEISTRVQQPQCRDAPESERGSRRCHCAWGPTCLCRARLVHQPHEHSCLVQTMTEYEEGVPTVREPDGGLRELIATIVERGSWRDGVRLQPGESTSFCGMTLTCLRLKEQ